MNKTPEFDREPFDEKLGRRFSGYFSRIGLALALMMVVYIGLQLLAVALISRFAPEFMNSKWYTWALSLIPLYLCGVPVFALVIRRVPVVRPERKSLHGGDFFAMLVMCFGVMYAGSYLGSLLMALINPEATNSLSEQLMSSEPLINLCVTVLLAPAIEELIFRRAIIDRTRAYGEGIAIAFSALMFGLFHGNLYQFFYAFGIGLLLGYVYVRTGRVLYTMLMHAVLNFFGGVVAPFILSHIDADELELLLERTSDMAGLSTFDPSMLEGISSATVTWIMLYGVYSMVFMVLAIAGVILLLVRRRRFHLERAEFPLPRERVGGVVYFNPGVVSAILICLVLMALSVV